MKPAAVPAKPAPPPLTKSAPSTSSAQKAKPATAPSTTATKGAVAAAPAKTKGTAAPAPSNRKSPASAASAKTPVGGKGAPTSTKSAPVAAAAPSKGKPSRQGQAAKGRAVTGKHQVAKTSPVFRSASRKPPYAMTPAPVARPAFTPLPLIDLSTAESAPEGMPLVRSGSALVVDASGEELYAKNPDVMLPIASITKLMTAMVVLDSGAPLHELITISAEDRDWLRGSRSRLQDGHATLSRIELLQLALMSSENRAAAALARTTFPGGTPAFVAAMNRKAQSLGMTRSHFADGTGLDGQNTSTARDLVQLLRAAYEYPEIRYATTSESAEVQPYGEYRSLFYRNTNRLVRTGDWQIELSKTGYLNEAGRCLAMRTRIEDRPLYMVFLNAPGKLTPFEDSNRLRRWLESRS